MADNPPKEKTEVSVQSAKDAQQAPASKTRVAADSPAAEQTASPQIPDHHLLRCIGRGSYGEVWLARNVMGTYRAVKIVHRKNFDNDRPYEREFDGIQKFEPVSRAHEGLVDILHVGRNDKAGYFYYVMELADDVMSSQSIDADRYEPKTLQREIHQRGRLPMAECLPISLSLTKGLGHLHQEGLVHRDIKPSNIIFVKGVPKLADIGLVCGTEATHSYVGTEGFIPLEGPGTPQADIYSLGKVFYEMSTGKDRHEFPDLATDLRGQETERAPLLEFNEVVLKACADDMRKRYQTASEMEADLALLQMGKSVKRQRTRQQRWVVAKVLAAAAAMVMLVLTVLPLIKKDIAQRPIATKPEAASIAVLPFLNESPKPEDEYLSGAIPDEVINALTQITGIKVAARNSSFAFKASEEARLVGRRLRVGSVLQGSIRKSGDKLYVTVQIVSAEDGYQAMSKSFHRDIKDLLTIHNDIARQVAVALKVPLGPEEVQHLAKKPTENLAAYQLYLVGRQHWNERMKPGEPQKATDYFQRAIQLDTNFALAYAGLADVHASRGYLEPGDLAPGAAFPQAKQFATQALALDDRLAEAHTSLGWAGTHYDWNWIQAEKELRQAIEINPNYGSAHHWYSHLLTALGRTSESFRESKLAIELELIDPVVNLHLAWHYFYDRQYDRAIEHCEKSIPLDPDFPMFYYARGWPHDQKRDFAKAIVDFQKAVELSRRRPLMLASLGHAYAASGARKEAQQILGELNERAKNQYVDPAEVAFIYVGLGDKEEAFAHLNKALQDRSGWLAYLNMEPRFDPLRDDPRFIELVKAVGLPLPAGTNSVAVLPFEDLSGEQVQEHYVAGLTDTLINKLAGLQALDVRSRERVTPYKGITNSSLLEVARALGVRFLVRGVVQRSSGWLAINVQLLRSPSETPIWTERFEDQENNALRLQGVVAKELARAIQVNFSPQEQQRLERAPAAKPEALALYFSGQGHASRENPKDNDTAISLLEKAVQTDPGFADAHAELANAYVTKSFYFDPTTPGWKLKAGTEVKTALALDPDSALAHVANGHLIWAPSPRDFPHERAVQELKHALKLNPNLDEAHQWLAMIYLHVGLLDKALAEAWKAIELNPANFMAHYRVGVILHLQGKYADALAKLETIPEEINPDLLGRQVPWTLFQLNRRAEARARIQKFLEKDKQDRGGQLASIEAMIDAAEGKAAEAESRIQRALQNPQVGHFHHTAYNVACAYALLNKPAEALSWLRYATETGYPCYPLFATDPNLNKLQTNEQFISFQADLRQKWEHYQAVFN